MLTINGIVDCYVRVLHFSSCLCISLMLVYCKVGELFTDDGKRQRLSRSGKRPRLHLEEEEDETGAGSKRADVDYSIVGGVLGVAKSGPTVQFIAHLSNG